MYYAGVARGIRFEANIWSGKAPIAEDQRAWNELVDEFVEWVGYFSVMSYIDDLAKLKSKIFERARY